MALLGFSILVYKTHIFIPTYTFSELKCQSLEYGRVHFFVFLQVRTYSINSLSQVRHPMKHDNEDQNK